MSQAPPKVVNLYSLMQEIEAATRFLKQTDAAVLTNSGQHHHLVPLAKAARQLFMAAEVWDARYTCNP
jgi:hypothetical protein